ncbi:MAG: peptidoglycan editing factor PgeF [Alphaproteobacteria bacterium]|nr:MAG: peptidoglycan editing factor PgeF [Alphaproteobacteria bacterium]
MSTSPPLFLSATEFDAEWRAAGIRHGFFTRQGGVSRGIYQSLNVGTGSDDDPRAVRENRSRARRALGAAGLFTPWQVHGRAVQIVDDAGQTRARADAAVTRRPGLAVGVVTADCVPLLLADADRGIVAAAHAGWRGAVAGIVESVTAAMVDLGAHRSAIAAAIGPAIGPHSYEVGEDLRTAVLAAHPRAASFFRPARRSDRRFFDLPGFAAWRLREAGIERVTVIPADTCADEARFFSYRRACREGAADYGRQLSAIVIAAQPE